MERQREYVGINLHRRRSVMVRMDGDGTVLDTVRIENDPIALAAELAKIGPEPEVAMEATLGWYWAADVMNECGAHLHLGPSPGDQGLCLSAGQKWCPHYPAVTVNDRPQIISVHRPAGCRMLPNC